MQSKIIIISGSEYECIQNDDGSCNPCCRHLANDDGTPLIEAEKLGKNTDPELFYCWVKDNR